MTELRCHWCHRLGRKKSQCPNLNDRRGPAKPVGLVSVGREVSDSAEGLRVPVTILRDTGAKQTLLWKGVV